MAFCSPKACGGVGGFRMPFSFRQRHRLFLSVGRPEVRPTDLRMAVFTSVASPADLLRGEKALKC